MPASDHYKCPRCGGSAQEGCYPGCGLLWSLAEDLVKAGYDPEDYEGASLRDRINNAHVHMQDEAQ